jgi:hypothetical protein
MPLFRRYGRPGLLDVVGPSAIVTGTPAMVSRALDRSLVLGLSSTPGTDATWSLASQLRTLSELRAAGHISADEFSIAKGRLFDA